MNHGDERTEGEEALELFSLSEILDLCEMPEADALDILIYHGYIKLPDFLERVMEEVDE